MHNLDYFSYLLGKSMSNIDSSEENFEIIYPRHGYNFSYKFSDVIGNIKIEYNEENRNQNSIELNLSSKFVPEENIEKFITDCIISNKVFQCKSSPFQYLEEELGLLKTIFPRKEKINSDTIRFDINNKLFETSSEYFKERAEEDFIRGVKKYIILPTTLLSEESAPKLSDGGSDEPLII
tara:strand:+ start:95 stop:634 length:540 start_codon:yes stop_codon:yes gene_type:complete